RNLYYFGVSLPQTKVVEAAEEQPTIRHVCPSFVALETGKCEHHRVSGSNWRVTAITFGHKYFLKVQTLHTHTSPRDEVRVYAFRARGDPEPSRSTGVDQ